MSFGSAWRPDGRGLRVTLVCIALFAGWACNSGGDSDGKSVQGIGKSKQGMFKSTGQFSKGYQDGMNEAQKSWTDWNGARMWLWTADAEYKKGYDRGWSDGRTVAKLKANAQKQQGGRRSPTADAYTIKHAQAAEQNPTSKITPEHANKPEASKQ
jgi:hypothetical protein